MTDLTQAERLIELVSGILGFVLLVMMLAVIRRLRGGLLFRALIPWTIALFILGLDSMLRVLVIWPSMVSDALRLLLLTLYLIGGVILWNRLREVS